MESRIARAIETKYPPIAISWADEKTGGGHAVPGREMGLYHVARRFRRQGPPGGL